MGPQLTIEQRIGVRLAEVGRSVCTAESCTGGLIAHRLTNVSGSSAYFLGGIVAYSNEAKVRHLGVSQADLDGNGAVSDPVACEMALGARAAFGADYAVAVTGIAGPGGGTAAKPVGLVFIAVASAEGVVVSRGQFAGGREAIKAQTADAALEMLWEGLG
ncbi:MAG TPA: CinA family protein [Candidatus Hydrogenedentes bacterium]|nr:CinA family protein [Candidatus Hydrogenedentota bacterium]HPG66954.1 CinA family protein [Candidatus Hydrogenedentota bacterium]